MSNQEWFPKFWKDLEEKLGFPSRTRNMAVGRTWISKACEDARIKLQFAPRDIIFCLLYEIERQLMKEKAIEQEGI